MSQLGDYVDQIKAQLDATAGLAGITILLEDVSDLETEISTALKKPGMLILIGMPSMENTMQVVRGAANMKIRSEIAIGENPTMWRDRAGDTKPHAREVAQLVAEALQGLAMDGYEPLRVMAVRQVPEKTRQLYELPIESQTIIQATANSE